jgi:hypothetical protein
MKNFQNLQKKIKIFNKVLILISGKKKKKKKMKQTTKSKKLNFDLIIKFSKQQKQTENIQHNQVIKYLKTSFRNNEENNIKLDYDEKQIKNFEYNISNDTLKKLNSGWVSMSLKKKIRKNCDSIKNKFSIKIINTTNCSLIIGLSEKNFLKKFDLVGGNKTSWGLNCLYGSKIVQWKQSDVFNLNKICVNDVFSIKFDSIMGRLEAFKNNKYLGVFQEGIDVKKEYEFVISVYWT